jgi:hypothetical protein
MRAEQVFLYSLAIFPCGWAAVAYLYWFHVVPAVRKQRGPKALLEATFQINLTGHLQQYCLIAKRENDRKMMGIYNLLSALVALSVSAFLVGILATVF